MLVCMRERVPVYVCVCVCSSMQNTQTHTCKGKHAYESRSISLTASFGDDIYIQSEYFTHAHLQRVHFVAFTLTTSLICIGRVRLKFLFTSMIFKEHAHFIDFSQFFFSQSNKNKLSLTNIGWKMG